MATTLLNAVTATGAGTAERTHPVTTHWFQIYFTGTVTALTVAMETSLDGTNWVVIATKAFSAGEITAKCAALSAIGYPTERIRANITAYTGTGPVTVLYERERHSGH